MANATNVVAENKLIDPCTRIILGTVGATGNLDLGDGFNTFDSISIQGTGTFDSATVTVNISNDGTNYVPPTTATALTTGGIKNIAVADLGFRYMRFVMASGAGSADVDFTIVCSRRNHKAK